MKKLFQSICLPFEPNLYFVADTNIAQLCHILLISPHWRHSSIFSHWNFTLSLLIPLLSHLPTLIFECSQSIQVKKGSCFPPSEKDWCIFICSSMFSLLLGETWEMYEGCGKGSIWGLLRVPWERWVTHHLSIALSFAPSGAKLSRAPSHCTEGVVMSELSPFCSHQQPPTKLLVFPLRAGWNTIIALSRVYRLYLASCLWVVCSLLALFRTLFWLKSYICRNDEFLSQHLVLVLVIKVQLKKQFLHDSLKCCVVNVNTTADFVSYFKTARPKCSLFKTALMNDSLWAKHLKKWPPTHSWRKWRSCALKQLFFFFFFIQWTEDC